MGNIVPDNEQNAKLCICPDCPTYQKLNLTGILYCAKGKDEQKGQTTSCICPNCEVYKQNSLTQLLLLYARQISRHKITPANLLGFY